jgi:hypothetical protein
MSAGTIEAMKAENWSLGQAGDGTVILRIDTSGGHSIINWHFALHPDEAAKLAKAILEQPAIAARIRTARHS